MVSVIDIAPLQEIRIRRKWRGQANVVPHPATHVDDQPKRSVQSPNEDRPTEQRRECVDVEKAVMSDVHELHASAA